MFPDLPYLVSRTRNHLLPVYYHLDDDPQKCYTVIKQVFGDIWQLESDLRAHLERLKPNKIRMMSSVYETDGRVLFRGRHLKEVVDWLHNAGF